jgi:flavin reductase (DIM6/NTAB) family NADH-FMN oxidoreductase RutF
MGRAHAPAAGQLMVDARRFRDTLGRFATGVTVITASSGGREHGMTANAFLSLSLDPPLVGVAVGRQTRMHAFLAASGRFGVSVLRQDQEAVARYFVGRPDEAFRVPVRMHRELPLISGAIAWLTAAVVDAREAGDHSLFIGQVDWLDHAEGEPLLFFEGRLFGLEPEPLAGGRMPFSLDIQTAPEIQRRGHTLVADWP